MALLDDIDAAEDVEELLLVVPAWPSASHPEGIAILFRGATFNTLLELQDTIKLKAVQDGEDMESMIDLIALTAYDPETRERIFDSEEGKAILRRKSYKTLLFLLQKGATVVVGTDDGETAGKDSSSTEKETPVSDDSSSPSPETQDALSGSFSTVPPLTEQ
jgi:hypothetical protein